MGQRSSVPKLVHLNGAPGVGKSALAARLKEVRPHVEVVDVDLVRIGIEGWESDETSKLAARDAGLGIASSHLVAGSDVVLPQLMMRKDAIAKVAEVAASASADFAEVWLDASDEEIVRRITGRRAALDSAGLRHPALVIEPGQEMEHIEAARTFRASLRTSDPHVADVLLRDGSLDECAEELATRLWG